MNNTNKQNGQILFGILLEKEIAEQEKESQVRQSMAEIKALLSLIISNEGRAEILKHFSQASMRNTVVKAFYKQIQRSFEDSVAPSIESFPEDNQEITSLLPIEKDTKVLKNNFTFLVEKYLPEDQVKDTISFYHECIEEAGSEAQAIRALT